MWEMIHVSASTITSAWLRALPSLPSTVSISQLTLSGSRWPRLVSTAFPASAR